jgi:hypothetical protein
VFYISKGIILNYKIKGRNNGTLQEHFQLQYQLLNRHLREFGITPWLAYGLMAVLFVGISELFFRRLIAPEYIYPLIGLSFFGVLQNAERSEFFKRIYLPQKYQKIRMAEYLLLALPIVIFLLFKAAFLSSVGFLIIALMMRFLPDMKISGQSLPTPFGRFPFEFSVGFRKSFPGFILAAILLGIGLKVDNFNLGMFSLGLVFFIFLGYFSLAEPLTYIRFFTCSKSDFLQRKMKTAALYSIGFALPYALVLGMFYPEKILFIAVLLVLGILYVWAALLGKYAAYPSTLNILQGFALGFSLMFPPLLLLIIPWFYKLALKNNKILLDA